MAPKKSVAADGTKQTRLPFPTVKERPDPFKQERKKTAAISITVEPKSQSKKRNLSTTTKTDKGSSGRSRSKSAGPPKSRSSPTGTPRKVAKRTGGKGGKQGVTAKFYDSYEFNGEEFKVGDDVYIMTTEDPEELPEEDAEDMCVACGSSKNCHTIIECDRCLGGYHMGCLKPKLKAVPEGVWMCPCCVRGDPPAANRQLRTPYEVFLFAPQDREVLSLVRIAAIQKNRLGDGQVEIACRYYHRPQDTYLGRQAHHATREVFLGSAASEHWEPLECIFKHASVVGPKEFGDTEGTDVYLCEYEYDEKWKRFRRTNVNHALSAVDGTTRPRQARGKELDSDADSDDEEFDVAGALSSDGEEDDSDDDVKDRNFKPIYAFWAEKGMLPGFKGRRPPARTAARPTTGALNRQAAVGTVQETGRDESDGLVLVGAGAAAVPERAPLTPLATARRALALSSIPSSLPCRDKEKAQLTRFVDEAITEEGGGPGVLYVCGVPGTGKTACLNEVLASAKPRAAEAGVQLVFLNALSLPSPQHVYTKLWEKLTGQRVGPARALPALESMFSPAGSSQGGSTTQRACVTLLVVDEIDVLITKDQSVLYNLFEWPMRPGSRFAVVGVSNTHDLDERVLPRIQSRLAASKLAFSPYTRQQLTEIVDQRLKAAGVSDLVAKDAVNWAVQKVANTSGDVRRALEVLRRAVELAESEQRKGSSTAVAAAAQAVAAAAGQGSAAGGTAQVKHSHVQIVLKEMYDSPHQVFLKACSRLEKLCLVGILMEMRAQSKAEITIQAVHHRLTTHIALMVPDAKFEAGTVARAVFNMAAKHLLLTGPSWQGIKARVALALHKDDVCIALRQDEDIKKVLESQLA